MKTLILATTIALTLSLNVNAGIKTDLSVSAAKSTVNAVNSKSSKPASEFDGMDYCIGLSESAGKIMTWRQNGVLLSTSLKRATNRLGRTMVLNAYKMNAYSSKEYKQKQIVKYSNMVMLECLKTHG